MQLYFPSRTYATNQYSLFFHFFDCFVAVHKIAAGLFGFNFSLKVVYYSSELADEVGSSSSRAANKKVYNSSN